MNQKLFKVLGLMLILAMAFSLLTACGGKEATKASTEGEAGETTGQPGPAIDLTGDAVAGAVIFKDKCAECHGEEGKGGVKNAGAEEPIVPGLNPLDPEFVSTDAKEFATKITRGAPLAMKAIKEITYGALEWPVSTVLKENGARFQSTSLTEDSKEGVQSFLEKREPHWKGR